jgi:hypothetical protein
MSLALEYPHVGQWLSTAFSAGPNTVGALRIVWNWRQKQIYFGKVLFLLVFLNTRQVVPWLNMIVAGHSTRRPGFKLRPVHERFVVDDVSIAQILASSLSLWVTRWRSWLRHCATSRKVAGSIPDGVIWFFHWHNPSGRTMALALSQPLTEISTRNVSWGQRRPVRLADNLTIFMCRLS